MSHPTSATIVTQPTSSSDNFLSPNYKSLASANSRNALIENDGLGLASLEGTQHLFIKQTVLVADMFINAPNKFEILNSSGERILIAAETTSLMTSSCCGGMQPFELSVYNARPLAGENGRNPTVKTQKFGELLKIEGFPGSCQREGTATVTDTDGRTSFGSVLQSQYCNPVYVVKDHNEQDIFQIRGPKCGGCCPGIPLGPMSGTVRFEILKPDGVTPVGRIAKQWGGLSRELFTRADIWGIKFTSDMTIANKAVLMSAVFLLDYQYFEK